MTAADMMYPAPSDAFFSRSGEGVLALNIGRLCLYPGLLNGYGGRIMSGMPCAQG